MKSLMKTKIKAFILLFIILGSKCDIQYYPEDYTSLDRTSYNNNEVVQTAYYFENPFTKEGAIEYDYRNGMVLFPFNNVIFFIKPLANVKNNKS